MLHLVVFELQLGRLVLCLEVAQLLGQLIAVHRVGQLAVPLQVGERGRWVALAQSLPQASLGAVLDVAVSGRAAHGQRLVVVLCGLGVVAVIEGDVAHLGVGYRERVEVFVFLELRQGLLERLLGLYVVMGLHVHGRHLHQSHGSLARAAAALVQAIGLLGILEGLLAVVQLHEYLRCHAKPYGQLVAAAYVPLHVDAFQDVVLGRLRVVAGQIHPGQVVEVAAQALVVLDGEVDAIGRLQVFYRRGKVALAVLGDAQHPVDVACDAVVVLVEQLQGFLGQGLGLVVVVGVAVILGHAVAHHGLLLLLVVYIVGVDVLLVGQQLHQFFLRFDAGCPA